jgi:hypothetical protein
MGRFQAKEPILFRHTFYPFAYASISRTATSRDSVALAAKKCLNLKKGPVQHTVKDIDNGYL